MREYANTFVMHGGRAYRVAFYVPRRRAMIVCRPTKNGEVVLDMSGPTAVAVIEAARRQMWPPPLGASPARSPQQPRETLKDPAQSPAKNAAATPVPGAGSEKGTAR